MDVDGGDRPAVAALAGDAGWARGGGALVRDLGFTLIHSDRPWEPGGSHLLVALRATPTLRHFDPEEVRYWAAGTPHARQVVVDRRSLDAERSNGRPNGTARRVLWGHVHLVDRLSVENRFLTFGGRLRTAVLDHDTTLIDLRSPAPILRWGGHSQETDALATEVGAFFGRLIVPVDFMTGAERRLIDAEPELVYATFLAWATDRLRRIAAATGRRSEIEAWIAHEHARIRIASPEVVAGAEALLAELGLAVP